MDARPPNDKIPGSSLEDFLRLYYADRDGGVDRSLDEYKNLFPGHANTIDRGYRFLDDLGSSSSTVRIWPIGESSAPDQIGPYRLIKLLGRGGQGEVHLAEDTRIGRRVALKVLGQGAGVFSTDGDGRFRREAEVAARLDHPNICPLYDMDLTGTVPYLVMPYLEGETLDRKIKRARTEGTGLGLDVLGMMETLARAMHAAHESGIVHRDIKPANIMIRPDGEPVILDMGLARDVTGEEATLLTMSGQLLGTLPYMAPEQVDGSGTRADARADVWALGVTMFECLTLRRPFEGPTQRDLMEAILRMPVPDPRRLERGISRDVAVVLETALEKDLRRRYRTAGELADEVQRVQQGHSIQARPAGWPVRAGRWMKRNPTRTVATASILVLGVVALIVAQVLPRLSSELEEAQQLLVDEQERREIASDELLVGDLPRQVVQLWPARPAMVTAARGMDFWLATARELEARLPRYEELFRQLQREGGTEESDPLARRSRERILERIERGQQALEWNRKSNAPYAEEWVAELEETIQGLEAQLAVPDLTFADPEQTRVYASLKTLVSEIPKLDPLRRIVEDRKAYALSVERLSIEQHREAWQEAITAVAVDPRFAGFELQQRVGLVPLGHDPDTGLQEFAHLDTGTPPVRQDGRLVLEEDSGAVMVLVPGGTFLMGAHPPDEDHPPGSPNVDPLAIPMERPVHEVTLDPFYIGKFTLTQGQWMHVARENPSGNAAGLPIGGVPVTLLNPVESVSWNDARRVLANLEMVLPTEAQWEYAARAGTTTPWFTGENKTSVEGFGNIADAYAKSLPGQSTWQYEEWMNDGHFVHSQVGTFRANPFGLHDIVGNIYEWCADGFSFYAEADPRPGDGLRSWTLLETRAARGAGYSSPASAHRMSARARFTPDMEVYYLGVRPAIYPANR